MKKKDMINNECKLVLNNNFVLIELPIDIDQYGVTFKTDQKTGYHSFSNVKELTLVE